MKFHLPGVHLPAWRQKPENETLLLILPDGTVEILSQSRVTRTPQKRNSLEMTAEDVLVLYPGHSLSCLSSNQAALHASHVLLPGCTYFLTRKGAASAPPQPLSGGQVGPTVRGSSSGRHSLPASASGDACGAPYKTRPGSDTSDCKHQDEEFDVFSDAHAGRLKAASGQMHSLQPFDMSLCMEAGLEMLSQPLASHQQGKGRPAPFHPAPISGREGSTSMVNNERKHSGAVGACANARVSAAAAATESPSVTVQQRQWEPTTYTRQGTEAASTLRSIPARRSLSFNHRYLAGSEWKREGGEGGTKLGQQHHLLHGDQQWAQQLPAVGSMVLSLPSGGKVYVSTMAGSTLPAGDAQEKRKVRIDRVSVACGGGRGRPATGSQAWPGRRKSISGERLSIRPAAIYELESSRGSSSIGSYSGDSSSSVPSAV